MNAQELKEAIEKSNMNTEAKAELIEIVEEYEQTQETNVKIYGIAIRWNAGEKSELVAMHDIWGLLGYPTKLKEEGGDK